MQKAHGFVSFQLDMLWKHGLKTVQMTKDSGEKWQVTSNSKVASGGTSPMPFLP